LTFTFLRLNFAAGFFGVRTYETDYHQLIMVESGGINNTLAPYEVCPNSNKAEIGGQGSTMAEKWIAVYLEPATKRLAPMISGVNLTIIDLFEMQLTCAYEVSHSCMWSLLDSRTCFRQLPWGTLNFVDCSRRKNGGVSNTLLYVQSTTRA
jgi:hypothetical protein